MASSEAALRLHPYFGYRSARQLTLTVRAMRGAATGWDHRSTFARMRALWRHYGSREVPGVPLTVEAGSGSRTVRATCTTDAEGYCRFDIALESEWPLPARTAWEAITLRWLSEGEAQSLTGYVLAPGTANRLAVISDIDDTIIETGAHDLWRNWRRVLAQMPADRQPVPGAAEFYARLGGEVGGASYPASQRPFFYVSSSPWNLFDYLLAFKSAHGLPHGPMLLRDWGFNRATLLPSSHGAHKAASVSSLLGFYDATRFALIGDSTQSDAIAYAEAVRRHSDRIAGVLIRMAPGAAISVEEREALRTIEQAGVPLWVGSDFAVEDDFLRTLGLDATSDARAIVDTMHETDTVPGTTASSTVNAEEP
jgi:phosphatidate phosphatase APP1